MSLGLPVSGRSDPDPAPLLHPVRSLWWTTLPDPHQHDLVSPACGVMGRMGGMDGQNMPVDPA